MVEIAILTLLSVMVLCSPVKSAGRELPLETGGVVGAVAWSSDGKLLATVVRPGEHVFLWRVGGTVAAIDVSPGAKWGPMKEGPSALAFSPDGSRLAMCSFGGQLVIVDVRDQTSPPLSNIATGIQNVRLVEFLPDGETVIVGGSKVSFLNVKKNAVAHQIDSRVMSGQVSPFGNIFVGVPDDFRVQGLIMCKLPEFSTQIVPVEGLSSTSVVAFAPGGKQVACANVHGRLLLNGLEAPAFQPIDVGNRPGASFHEPVWFDDDSLLAVSYDRRNGSMGFSLWHIDIIKKNVLRFYTLFGQLPTSGRFPSVGCEVNVQPGKGDRLVFAKASSVGLAEKHVLFHTSALQDFAALQRQLQPGR